MRPTHQETGFTDDDTALAWSDAYSVGDERLDDEHRMLFDLVNVLPADPRQLPPQALPELFAALGEYVDAHFSHEEQYQAQIGFFGATAHRVQHRRLLERLAHFRRLWDESPATLDVRELRRFLRHWIVHHVAHEDMQFRRFAEDLQQARDDAVSPAKTLPEGMG